MSLWNEEHARLVSRPVKVRWAGWETDTYRLQQAGWKICMEQSVMDQTMRMAVKHDEHRMVGLTGPIPMLDPWDHSYHPSNFGSDRWAQTHVYSMDHMARDIFVTEPRAFVDFRAVDCEPRLDMVTPKSLSDLLPFAEAPLVRTRALILPEASVDELLAGILERQRGAKEAYFRDMVEEERRKMPRHQIHAQIISLAA